MSSVVRICPLCGKHNPTTETFCICGTLLADVDFTHIPDQPIAAPQPAAVAPPQPIAEQVICPHADCAQPNPPGLQRCVYCDRELQTAENQSETGQSQNVLPPTLRSRFSVLEVLPTEGAQADLILVETKQSATPEKRMLKLYRKGLKPDWKVLERLPAINSHHLVRLYEHRITPDATYELMEYCAEGTLRDLLEEGPLADDTVPLLISQLSTTLTALHQQHILHRDLKPENILLRSRAPLEVAISDFGASTLKMATQYFTGGARTVSYAAPEVLTGVLDEKSDWWSLGMILLEAITGRHPYAGLSEQVVLHQLATESVDVKLVFDQDLRKLCRGLLLRNPKKRWGANEVARWLAGDESLTMPEDGNDSSAVKPYTIGRSQCLSSIDLALALARYWEDGKLDLKRGVIAHWVDHDLRDFNLGRHISNVMNRNDWSDDAKLLRVIVHALPGIPPIWRGKVITQQTLARCAKQADQEDRDALDWLLSIYKEDVLKILGEAGNADMSAIAEQWQQGVNTFRVIWEQARVMEDEWRRRPRSYAGEFADFDYQVYVAPIRMNSPGLGRIVPDLLLALYLPGYVDRTRNAVRNACHGVAEHCEWYTALAKEVDETENAIGWSTLQRLLPLAVEDSEKEKKRYQQQVRNEDIDVLSVSIRIEDACKKLLLHEHVEDINELELENLRKEMLAWVELAVWVKGLEHSNKNLHELVEKMNAETTRVMQLQGFLDDHQHLLEINQIWLKPTRIFFGLTLMLGAMAHNLLIAAVLAVVAVGYFLWRRKKTKESAEEGLRRQRRMMYSIEKFYETNFLNKKEGKRA